MNMNWNKITRIFSVIGVAVAIAMSLVPVAVSAAPSQPDNPPGVSIVTAQCFQNIYQTGDILIIMEYNIPYASAPTEDPSDLFYISLIDTTNPGTPLTPTPKPLFYYNYNIAAFYFSANDVSSLGLTFGDTNYAIQIKETALFSTPVTYPYPLNNSAMWHTQSDMTLSQGYVQAYIINTIMRGPQGLQTVNSGTSYTTNTLTQGTVLNAAGRTLVLFAIPYLDTPIPQLFQVSVSQISVVQPTVPTTTVLQDNLTLQNQLGTQLSTAFTNFGALLHISGQQVAMGWILICILIVISIVFLATGNLIGATICALPMVIIGVWIGAIPVAFVFSGVMVIVVLLAFYLFIRGM
jgi:hypothetical protein